MYGYTQNKNNYLVRLRRIEGPRDLRSNRLHARPRVYTPVCAISRPEFTASVKAW
jgi:hypothetical protein